MREEFEKWLLEGVAEQNKQELVKRQGESNYWHPHVQCAWGAWQHQQKEIDKLTAEVKRFTKRYEAAENANERWVIQGYDYGTPVRLSEFEPKPKQTYLVTWLPCGETIAVQDSGTVQAWKEDTTDSGEVANAVTYVYPNPVPMPMKPPKEQI